MHRSTKLLGSLLFASILGSCSAAPSESPSQASLHSIKIVCLGASDTDGPGVRDSETYPAQLQTALRAAGYNVTVKNEGRSGNTTDYIRRREPEATQGAQIVIFQPGGNDRLGNRSQNFVTLTREQTEANIDAVLKDLRARRVQVFMFTYWDDANGFDAHSANLAADSGAAWLGGFHQGVPISAHLSDGHMNARGYAMVVDRILPQIKAAVDSIARLNQ